MGIDIIIITIVVLGMTIWFIDQTRRKTKYGHPKSIPTKLINYAFPAVKNRFA